MIVFRTYDQPKPYVHEKDGIVVWGIPCLTDEDISTIFFDNEDNAWKFFNEVNFQFEPLRIDDEDEVPTTQT